MPNVQEYLCQGEVVSLLLSLLIVLEVIANVAEVIDGLEDFGMLPISAEH
jgi:hypothetical protein